MARRHGAHDTRVRGWLRRVVPVALGAAMLLATGAGQVSVAAADCRVRNAATDQMSASLQDAVDAAGPQDTLLVRGTCQGATVIGKSLTIEGVWTRRLGPAILDGGGTVRPVTVKLDRPAKPVLVAIKRLTIRNGRAPYSVSSLFGAPGGGGIWVTNATLKLMDVVVRDNQADGAGGGIQALWSEVRLNGTTRVTGNRARDGGGVACLYCWLVMNDESRIVDNVAQVVDGTGGTGGGVALSGGLKLNDDSMIARNSAGSHGGGVWGLEEDISLNDRSSIRDNQAVRFGGGIYDATTPWDYYGPASIGLDDASSVSGNRAIATDNCCDEGCAGTRSWAGGIRTGTSSRLVMTGSSVVTGNQAACGAGGVNVWDEHEGLVCAPDVAANVLGNLPDDCRFH